MSATAETNGHAPEDEREAFEWAVNAEIESLRSLLGAQQQITRELAAQLEAQRSREKRIEKALIALGEQPQTTPPPPKKTTPKPRYGYASPESVEAVAAALGELGEATVPQLRQQTGKSEPTVRAALEKMRQVERVRVTGHAGGPQGAKQYALMPGADSGA
jgi:hypothetical protein